MSTNEYKHKHQELGSRAELRGQICSQGSLDLDDCICTPTAGFRTWVMSQDAFEQVGIVFLPLMYFTADHGHRGHLKDRTAVPVRCSARFVHYTSVVISMHLHLLSDETLDSALIMVWGILVFFLWVRCILSLALRLLQSFAWLALFWQALARHDTCFFAGWQKCLQYPDCKPGGG